MRKCFVYALDYSTYIEQVLRGKGVQQNVMMPSSFLGYDKELAPQEYDMAKAEEFCKAAHGGAAWEQGFTLNATYLEGYTNNQLALEFLKQSLEGMNPKFKINMVGKPLSEFVPSVDKEAMAQVGWGPDYADPDNFIYTFYHPDGFYASLFSLDDSQLNTWIEEARATTDETRRRELYGQIAERALDQAYYVNIPVGLSYLAYHNNLEGLSVDTYNPMFGYYWKDLSKIK